MPIARENMVVYAALDERTLIERALAQLRAMGLTVGDTKLAGRGQARNADAHVRLGYGKVMHEYAIEAKKHLTPANLGATLQQLAAAPDEKDGWMSGGTPLFDAMNSSGLLSGVSISIFYRSGSQIARDCRDAF